MATSNVVRYPADHASAGQIDPVASTENFETALYKAMEFDSRIASVVDAHFDAKEAKKDDKATKTDTLVSMVANRLLGEEDIDNLETYSEAVADFVANNARFEIKSGKNGGVRRLKKPAV